MNTNYLQLAVANNAIWCATVCRSHNIQGEFHKTFWMIKQQAPTYYPNLITLVPATQIDLHQGPLATFLTEHKDYALSMKDSFADLDLNPFGFQLLFEAQWIFRPSSAEITNQTSTTLRWKTITQEDDLLHWEEAWSQTKLSRNHIFLPPLLHDENISIMAGYQGDQIITGAIANKAGGVIGISNVFTPEQEAEKYWEALLALTSTCYPGLPIVGYEQDESLELAKHVGFITLGPLRVWLKEE